MTGAAGRIIIVGGGIAGLCAAVYAQGSGYRVEILEQHHSPGGLATSWRRGDYTFETCLHWLAGSNPSGTLHAEWREVCDIDSLHFVDHDEFVRLEDQHGGRLRIYTDVDRLEAELLSVAPEDEVEIRHFAGAIRQLADLPMPRLDEPWPARVASMLKMLPDLPLLWRLSHLSVEDYGRRFSPPLLRAFFFGGGGAEKLSVLALVISLAWMGNRNAGYAIGGSQAIIRLILERFLALGGHIRCEARVSRILTEGDVATGVQLEDGETIAADWVISAADGHATLHDLLGGAYTDRAFETAFARYETFPSYLQVSLGVARDLSQEPGYLTLVLDDAVEVDPETRLQTLSYRIFHYDPTFAPPGKTAVTCFLPTRNFAFWADLRRDDLQRYQAEKDRVAQAVIAVLERRLPDIATVIETVDVSTPATVVRCTGNWKGSMEGWLMTSDTGFGSLPRTLPGLERFMMVGQWVQPGGGLPSGLLTARAAVRAICREDHAPFLPEGSEREVAE
ncbi:phytoene desaturase family protein [Labrys monachus]|uniref:Phytoene dehydrogenase-like protein n=1 Tax=Labrys monachus TaxID=217067 RepID=A0ABU0F946_9HYPH|nr:NAD(P)/FAD-dependent oxidoreductase [Labrys monachus]MDQ0390585.1 phytoene dehydrogenase-like protein [Labrys monachus]